MTKRKLILTIQFEVEDDEGAEDFLYDPVLFPSKEMVASMYGDAFGLKLVGFLAEDMGEEWTKSSPPSARFRRKYVGPSGSTSGEPASASQEQLIEFLTILHAFVPMPVPPYTKAQASEVIDMLKNTPMRYTFDQGAMVKIGDDDYVVRKSKTGNWYATKNGVYGTGCFEEMIRRLHDTGVPEKTHFATSGRRKR